MAGIWPKDMNVIAIVPTYQEADYIANVVRQLRKRKQEGLIQEIIVVDDGSTDGTAKIAKKAAGKAEKHRRTRDILERYRQHEKHVTENALSKIRRKLKRKR